MTKAIKDDPDPVDALVTAHLDAVAASIMVVAEKSGEQPGTIMAMTMAALAQVLGRCLVDAVDLGPGAVTADAELHKWLGFLYAARRGAIEDVQRDFKALCDSGQMGWAAEWIAAQPSSDTKH